MLPSARFSLTLFVDKSSTKTASTLNMPSALVQVRTTGDEAAGPAEGMEAAGIVVADDDEEGVDVAGTSLGDGGVVAAVVTAVAAVAVADGGLDFNSSGDTKFATRIPASYGGTGGPAFGSVSGSGLPLAATAEPPRSVKESSASPLEAS